MNQLSSQIESLLFISGQPLSARRLSELCEATREQIQTALAELSDEYAKNHGGVQINHLGDSYQIVTTGTTGVIVQKFLDEEEKKELTKPSLETLTIVAYRGPVTKAELELIRGVNCSLILRNLLIRGLIEEQPGEKGLPSRYQVTFDFLHYLGIREPRELPDYNKLNSDENLRKLFEESMGERSEAVSSDSQEISSESFTV